jgi:hypothetical protein
MLDMLPWISEMPAAKRLTLFGLVDSHDGEDIPPLEMDELTDKCMEHINFHKKRIAAEEASGKTEHWTKALGDPSAETELKKALLKNEHLIKWITKFKNLIKSNAIPLNGDFGEEMCAFFAIICRSNHSCYENAMYRWRADLPKLSAGGKIGKQGRQVIVAMRDIKEGEEIFVNYSGWYFSDREFRINHLRDSFNFDCACELCTDDELEAVQAEIAAGSEKVVQAIKERGGKALLEAKVMIERSVELCRTKQQGRPGRMSMLTHEASGVFAELAKLDGNSHLMHRAAEYASERDLYMQLYDGKMSTS